MNSCIKHLQKLEVAARSAKSPSMPVAYIIATNYSDKTANGLTKCIIEWLRYNNCQGERISNTGRIVSRYVIYSNWQNLPNRTNPKALEEHLVQPVLDLNRQHKQLEIIHEWNSKLLVASHAYWNTHNRHVSTARSAFNYYLTTRGYSKVVKTALKYLNNE